MELMRKKVPIQCGVDWVLVPEAARRVPNKSRYSVSDVPDGLPERLGRCVWKRADGVRGGAARLCAYPPPRDNQ
jgi:hypothetical protein